jgi:hypothetical protein
MDGGGRISSGMKSRATEQSYKALFLAVSIRQSLTRGLYAMDGGHVEFAGAKIDHALGKPKPR